MAGIPVVRGLIDTPILVDYRDGFPDAMQFFALVRQHGRPEFSELSALSLIIRCSDAAELNGLRTFFSTAQILSITARISRRAFMILDRLPPPSNLTPNDAIIAATAIEHSLPLYALDPARFAAVPGLTAIRPY